MGLLERFWYWLTSPGTNRHRKGHPDLHPIDVDKLAKELRLAEEAKRLGEASLPATDAIVISGPEAAVVQRVEKARQDYVDWAALRLNVLSQDLGRRNIKLDVNRARQADKEFERKASAILSENESALRSLGETARSRNQELDAFRSRHELTREAHYPSGTRAYFLYAILILLVAIEGLLNAGFFAQGLDSGLLGGFTMAGIMAAVNVTAAFLLGKFAVRYVNHRGTLPKLLGIAALAASLTLMAYISLGIAHYRDGLISGVENPAKAASDALLENPLQLRDFFSWALFSISMMFGIASLVDGLFSDDLYPGYGRISRRAKSDVEDYEVELDSLREKLENFKNEELDDLDNILVKAQANMAVFESLIKDKQMAQSRLSTALRDADNSLDALLKKFRTENEVYRQGLKRPPYFDKFPALRAIQTPDFSTSTDESAYREQRELVNLLLAEVQEIRGRIQAAFVQHFDRLKPLDSHFVSEEIPYGTNR